VNPPVSLVAPQYTSSPGPLLEAAAVAEAGGLAGLFLLDHLVAPGDAHRPVLELASTLGLAAAATTTLTIGTLVMRAPLRGAEISAAVAATAAAIAGGRFVLGLGAGDSRSADESRRYGQESGGLDERLTAVSDVLEATRPGGYPRWVGGTHRRVLELAARAEGWNGWDLDAEQFARLAARVRSQGDVVVTWGGAVLLGRAEDEVADLVAARGGSEGTIPGTPSGVAAQLSTRLEAGAEHLVVAVLPNRRDRWEMFVEEVVPRLA
jgi:alkanesulfonate monooxygenase SsuD/methylene tetrahydromethanopterin reductase-like flavin-dependent oxidoreductase (luciferase family)